MTLIGEAVRKARIATGMRANAAAQECGISAQYLNDIELGRRLPPPDTIIRLAAHLNDEHSAPWLWLWLRDTVGDDTVEVMVRYAATGGRVLQIEGGTHPDPSATALPSSGGRTHE